MKTMKKETTKKLIALADSFLELTEENRDLLLQIMDLTAGRPDLKAYALNYKGKLTDLPAALAQI